MFVPLYKQFCLTTSAAASESTESCERHCQQNRLITDGFWSEIRSNGQTNKRFLCTFGGSQHTTARMTMAFFFPTIHNMLRLSPKIAAGLTLTFAHSKVASLSSYHHPGVRVASYNVLSDSLSEPSHFFKCQPDDLDENVRFQRVKTQLLGEIEKGSVLCIQELSRNWGGKLIPFFEEHGYSYAGMSLQSILYMYLEPLCY